MRIEFDPTNRDEATAVRAVLDAMYPQEWTMKAYTAKPVDDQASADADDLKGVTVTREAIPTGQTEDGWETVEAGPVTLTDANGEPWDARIHSTPPTQNKDGTWRAKRGVTADVVAAVRAERTAPVGLIDNMTEEELSEDRSEENPNVGVPAQEQSAPPAPNAPVQAPTPPAPPSPTAAPSFLDVMKAITAAQKDGKIDTVKVKEMCAAVDAGDSTMGLNGPDNADKRSAFMALLQEVVG